MRSSDRGRLGARRFERRRVSWARVALLCALVAGAPAAASAGEDDSRTFFARGRELRQAGRCDEATKAFRRALELFPEGLGALLNIAECEEQLGRLASARRDYWDLRRAVLQSGEPKYEGWDKNALAAYERLGPRVPRLTVRLRGASDGAHVTLDGVPLDPRLLGEVLERDLGVHVVEASNAGAPSVKEQVTLGEGDRREIVLTLPAPAPDRGRPSGGASDGRGLRIAGVTTLVVGGVALAGAVVSAIVRQGALADLEAACPAYRDRPCPAAAQSPKDRGDTASLLVNVLGATAIGAGVAGGVMLWAGASRGAPAQPSAGAHAALAVGWSGRF